MKYHFFPPYILSTSVFAILLEDKKLYLLENPITLRLTQSETEFSKRLKDSIEVEVEQFGKLVDSYIPKEDLLEFVNKNLSHLI